MKHHLLFILSVALFFGFFGGASETFASVHVISPEKNQIFTNDNCQATQTCDLKEFRADSYDYKVDLSATDYGVGTDFMSSFTTDKTENLEKYGIVQFIRGCQFSSQKVNGQVVKYLNVLRPYYGKNVLFLHVDWQIDGLVSDPMDWGNDSKAKTRFDYYRWNSVMGSEDPSTEKYFFQAPPQNPRLYVTDHPGIADPSLNGGLADNISLQLKTCIYRAADTPHKVACDDIGFAQPLKCFEWSSSFIYNFDTNQFDSPTDLDPVCLQLPAQIDPKIPPACYTKQ